MYKLGSHEYWICCGCLKENDLERNPINCYNYKCKKERKDVKYVPKQQGSPKDGKVEKKSSDTDEYWCKLCKKKWASPPKTECNDCLEK